MNEVNEASPASETSDVQRIVMRFTPEYEAMVRAAINPQYIDQRGTESYERATLLAVIDSLRNLLDEAADDVQDWGGYASQYFQDKHNLAACVAKYRNNRDV